jgi:hypothetical protein
MAGAKSAPQLLKRSLILPLNPTQQNKKLGHGKRQPLEKVLDKGTTK